MVATYRVHKDKNYTVMSNYHLQDKNLSLKAKGLLSIILSLPGDWEYSVAGLCELSKDGRDGVASALKELRIFGYVVCSSKKGEDGRFYGADYDVFEAPQKGECIADLPFTENPLTEKPLTEKPQQLNTNNTNNTTNVVYTKRQSTIKVGQSPQKLRFCPPSVEEVRSYCEERGNGIDPETFIDFYTMKGWRVGKEHMKDWKAAVRTWERRRTQTKAESQKPKEKPSYDIDDFAAAAIERSYGPDFFKGGE